MEQQVLKVEEAITRVEVEIQIAADNITNAKSDRDKDRWWGKKKLLREKEKLLREEEKLLRAEKASLRSESALKLHYFVYKSSLRAIVNLCKVASNMQAC